MTDLAFFEPGPLLSQLLEAQGRAEQLVQFPTIDVLASGLIEASRGIGDKCLVWPLSPAAERLAGAAVIRSEGTVEVATWNTSVGDRRVLLVELVGVSPIAMETAAHQLRRRGAAEVHACAVEVNGLSSATCFDSHRTLTAVNRVRLALASS